MAIQRGHRQRLCRNGPSACSCVYVSLPEFRVLMVNVGTFRLGRPVHGELPTTMATSRDLVGIRSDDWRSPIRHFRAPQSPWTDHQNLPRETASSGCKPTPRGIGTFSHHCPLRDRVGRTLFTNTTLSIEYIDSKNSTAKIPVYSILRYLLNPNPILDCSSRDCENSKQ